ncbi:hypothetical protein G7046_g6201 [Stylonectria norvegica]|nr:hypothetical protein G7046_g6201 [Stylonectria norvegica]
MELGHFNRTSDDKPHAKPGESLSPSVTAPHRLPLSAFLAPPRPPSPSPAAPNAQPHDATHSHADHDAFIHRETPSVADDDVEQRIADFIRALKSGSRDALYLYTSLIKDFGNVDNRLPPAVLALIDSLGPIADLESPPPAIRDTRRGLGCTRQRILDAWGCTRAELEGFFDGIYLTRNMLSALKTLSETTDFPTASQLLRDARDRRRSATRDGVSWRGISRIRPWTLFDMASAVAAAGPAASGDDFSDHRERRKQLSQGDAVPSAPPEQLCTAAESVVAELPSQSHGHVAANFETRGESRIEVATDAADGGDEMDSLRHGRSAVVDEYPLSESPLRKRRRYRPEWCDDTSPEVGRFPHEALPIDWNADVEPPDEPIDDISSGGFPALGFQRLSTPIAKVDDFGLHSDPSGLPCAHDLAATVDDPPFATQEVQDAPSPDVATRNESQQDESLLPTSQLSPSLKTAPETQQRTRKDDMIVNPSPWNAESLHSLAPSTWLDDAAINCVLSIFVAAAEPAHFHLVDPILINCLSFPPLSPSQWTSTLLLPLHLETSSHWVLAVIRPDRNSVDFFDSLPSVTHLTQGEALVRRMMNRLLPQRLAPWRLVSRIAPRQENSHDCGLCVIVFALHIIAGCPLPASAIHGPLWRHILSRLLSPPSTPDMSWRDASICLDPESRGDDTALKPSQVVSLFANLIRPTLDTMVGMAKQAVTGGQRWGLRLSSELHAHDAGAALEGVVADFEHGQEEQDDHAPHRQLEARRISTSVAHYIESTRQLLQDEDAQVHEAGQRLRRIESEILALMGDMAPVIE